eukprot:7386222-Prymnesium_polylepis.1
MIGDYLIYRLSVEVITSLDRRDSRYGFIHTDEHHSHEGKHTGCRTRGPRTEPRTRDIPNSHTSVFPIRDTDSRYRSNQYVILKYIECNVNKNLPMYSDELGPGREA